MCGCAWHFDAHMLSLYTPTTKGTSAGKANTYGVACQPFLCQCQGFCLPWFFQNLLVGEAAGTLSI